MDKIGDTISSFTGSSSDSQQGQGGQQQQKGGGGGGFLGGIGDKLICAGGGKESEKNEDYLDKGRSRMLGTVVNSDCSWQDLNDPILTGLRYRLRPRARHGPRTSEQRVGHRASKGRADQ